VARPNVFSSEFDLETQNHGFIQKRVRVGQQAGAARLGASAYELPPGTTPFPYHLHYANEELLIVLSGSPSLRLPDGWHELASGDVVAFRVGEEGAHQVSNPSSEPARVLIVSTMVGPEVVRYPDSDKVAARAVAPGGQPGFMGVFSTADSVDYWKDEQPPAS
jgi:uncharacterized cupin superfamily protein